MQQRTQLPAVSGWRSPAPVPCKAGGGAAARSRRAPLCAAASLPPQLITDDPVRSTQEALAYGRAFATVLNRRVGELLTTVVGELPKQLEEFQNEVQAAAQEEMAASGIPPAGPAPAGGGASSSGGGSLPTGASGDGVRGYNTPPADLQAVVDELRADIAASRAVLQQLKEASANRY